MVNASDVVATFIVVAFSVVVVARRPPARSGFLAVCIALLLTGALASAGVAELAALSGVATFVLLACSIGHSVIAILKPGLLDPGIDTVDRSIPVRGRHGMRTSLPGFRQSHPGQDLPTPPRIRWIQERLSPGERVLNLGSKDVRLGTICADINRSPTIDMLADARSLPFGNGVFNGVVFSEVLEHLPRGHEPSALEEIHRVIRSGGWLLLTTPAAYPLYDIMDLAWYLGHRHYKSADVRRLLERAGFEVRVMFRGGGPGDSVSNLLYLLLIYPGIAPRKTRYSLLRWIGRLQSIVKEKDSPHGFTVFVEAQKPSVDKPTGNLADGHRQNFQDPSGMKEGSNQPNLEARQAKEQVLEGLNRVSFTLYRSTKVHSLG